MAELASKPVRSGGRVRSWFARRRSLREAGSSAALAALPFERFRVRALRAAELADTAARPSSSFAQGAPDALLCDLYRQSAYWALLALTPELWPGASAPMGSETGALAGSAPEPARLWHAAAPALLLRAAGGHDDLATVETVFVATTFRDVAEWDARRQAASLWSVQRFARALALELHADREATRRRSVTRWLRAGLVLALLGCVALAVLAWSRSREEAANLARLRPWRTSSSIGQGCRSPAQECDESQGFFFHTEEEKSPWVEIDFERVVQFSAVRLINRQDCCRARAVPLVIEVSDDQQKWQEVARRTESFDTWKATFPTGRARYLRVRALDRTLLHLREVRVLP